LGTNGKIERDTNDDRFGYALADCTEAYKRNSAKKPGAVVQYARRHAFFVYPHRGAPAYAVVMDDLRKDDRPHEFAWQMMFSDALEAALAEGRAVFEPRPPAGKTASPPVPAPTEKPREARPRLVLRIHADATPVLSTDVFQPKDYHAPAAFPRFRATVRGVNPRFIAVLLPLPAAAAEPEVRFESKDETRITTIRWPQHTDTLVWSEKDGSATLLKP
jgi:hypothetical protein